MSAPVKADPWMVVLRFAEVGFVGFSIFAADGKRCFDPSNIEQVEAVRSTIASAPRLAAEHAELRAALDAMTGLAREYLESTGGCDHSAGLCQCGDQLEVDRAIALLARLDGGK